MAQEYDNESVLAGFYFGLEIYDFLVSNRPEKTTDLLSFTYETARVLKEISEGDLVLTDSDAKCRLDIAQNFPTLSSMADPLAKISADRRVRHRALAAILDERYRGILDK